MSSQVIIMTPTVFSTVGPRLDHVSRRSDVLVRLNIQMGFHEGQEVRLAMFGSQYTYFTASLSQASDVRYIRESIPFRTSLYSLNGFNSSRFTIAGTIVRGGGRTTIPRHFYDTCTLIHHLLHCRFRDQIRDY